MHLRKAVLPLLLLSFALALGTSGQAQTYLDSTGAPTFTTAFPVENGFINLSNGNLHLEIPLASYPQRGKLGYTAKMVYDSRIWTPANLGSGLKWYPVNVPNSQGGWRFVDSANTGEVSETSGYTPVCWNPITESYEEYQWYVSEFVWTSPQGTQRRFDSSIVYESFCLPDPGQPNSESYADDGSGYFMKVTDYTNITIWAPDGTQVYPTVKDTNGNYFSYSGINTVDTLGRTPITRTTSGATTTLAYLKTGSGTANISVVTKTISPTTSFSQSGVSEYPGGNITVLDYIEFANGTRYTFGYDSTGELNSITLPTGGTISYTYGTVTDVNGAPEPLGHSTNLRLRQLDIYLKQLRLRLPHHACQHPRRRPDKIYFRPYSGRSLEH